MQHQSRRLGLATLPDHFANRAAGECQPHFVPAVVHENRVDLFKEAAIGAIALAGCLAGRESQLDPVSMMVLKALPDRLDVGTVLFAEADGHGFAGAVRPGRGEADRRLCGAIEHGAAEIVERLAAVEVLVARPEHSSQLASAGFTVPITQSRSTQVKRESDFW